MESSPLFIKKAQRIKLNKPEGSNRVLFMANGSEDCVKYKVTAFYKPISPIINLSVFK